MNGRELLLHKVGETSKTAVAEALGVSRTAISLIVNGKYNADPKRIYEKAIQVYGQVDCPHLGNAISPAECHGYANASAKAPTHNPAKMRHWNACRACPRRPTRGDHD